MEIIDNVLLILKSDVCHHFVGGLNNIARGCEQERLKAKKMSACKWFIK